MQKIASFTFFKGLTTGTLWKCAAEVRFQRLPFLNYNKPTICELAGGWLAATLIHCIIMMYIKDNHKVNNIR